MLNKIANYAYTQHNTITIISNTVWTAKPTFYYRISWDHKANILRCFVKYIVLNKIANYTYTQHNTLTIIYYIINDFKYSGRSFRNMILIKGQGIFKDFLEEMLVQSYQFSTGYPLYIYMLSIA